MSTNEFEVLKIKKHVLKVHINCYGCFQKVKKVLKRIEGVYTVKVDAEQQKVIVSGNVEASTLINKLVKTGKHAEIWSSMSNYNQYQEQDNYIRSSDNNINYNTGQMMQYVSDNGRGGGLENEWAFERHPNQILGIKPLTGEIDMMEYANMGMDDDDDDDYGDQSIGGDHNMHAYRYDVPSFHGNGGGGGGDGGADFVGFGGNHHGYGGLPAYEYEHHPSTSSMMMNNMQGQQSNQSARKMNLNMNMNMHGINNMMRNGNMYMNDFNMMNHNSSLVPPYSNYYYNFGSN